VYRGSRDKKIVRGKQSQKYAEVNKYTLFPQTVVENHPGEMELYITWTMLRKTALELERFSYRIQPKKYTPDKDSKEYPSSPSSRV